MLKETTWKKANVRKDRMAYLKKTSVLENIYITICRMFSLGNIYYLNLEKTYMIFDNKKFDNKHVHRGIL